MMKYQVKHLQRHKDVFDRHQSGETYKAIAKELGITPSRANSLAKRWEREMYWQDMRKEEKMTDRYFAVTVLLEKDTRTNDAKEIITALKMVKGVLKVEPHVANLELWASTERARQNLAVKLWEVLYPKNPQ